MFSVQYGIIEITELKPNILPVKKIISHENYINKDEYPNDIGIIEV